MKKMRLIAMLLLVVCFTAIFSGCTGGKKQVIIYSCANDKRIAFMSEKLAEKFPQYDCVVEYQSTSKLSAKLLAEGVNTDCDIVHDLSFLNMDALNEKGIIADVSGFDKSLFIEDMSPSSNYIIEINTAGGILINPDVIKEKNLEVPKSYEDLLKPEYKGLISMPDPKASGTGYMFLKSLVNAWGEEKAFDYFTKLSENILQFTSSGNGPANAVLQKEVAIGLGMINNGVMMKDEGNNIDIVVFEEGAPYSNYGQTIIKGKETKAEVKEVFEYLLGEYILEESEVFGREKIFKDYDFVSENYPKDVKLADMSGDTLEEKTRLLEKWTLT